MVGVNAFLVRAAAALAISAGASVKAVQSMLGHASAAMTLDRYGHLFGDDLDAVADRLDEAARVSVCPECAPKPRSRRLRTVSAGSDLGF